MKIVPSKKAAGVDYTPVGGYEKDVAVKNYKMSKISKAKRQKQRKARRKARRHGR